MDYNRIVQVVLPIKADRLGIMAVEKAESIDKSVPNAEQTKYSILIIRSPLKTMRGELPESLKETLGHEK